MKFYRINYGDCEGFKRKNDEAVVEWTTNLREAEKIARENNDGDYRSTVTEVDVPTDKAGLKIFLNRELWR